MKFSTRSLIFSCLLSASLVSGCASNSAWQTEYAPDNFVDGTRLMGEAILLTTREQVLANQGLLRGWRGKLLAAGYNDDDIVDGSEITIWAYCYGWNSGVRACAHHGHYVAHVPPELRGKIQFSEDGVPDTAGDLIEIELQRISGGQLVGIVTGVYRKASDWSPCYIATLGRDATLGTLVVGPPHASWIECEGAQSDGWIRRPVSGTPQSSGAPISEWIKTIP